MRFGRRATAAVGVLAAPIAFGCEIVIGSSSFTLGNLDGSAQADAADAADAGPGSDALADASNDGSIDAPVDAPPPFDASCVGPGCPLTLASGQQSPTELVIAGGRLFWTSFGDALGNGGSVASCALPACASVTTFCAGKGAFGIATDQNAIYWTNFAEGTARFASLPGPCASAVQIGNAGSGTMGIAVDTTTVYWVESGGAGTVNAANLNGSGVVTLASGQLGPSHIAPDTGTHVFWTNRLDDPQGVIRKPKLFGSIEALTSGSHAEGIVYNLPNIYFANSGSGASDGYIAKVVAGAVPPATATTLASGLPAPHLIATDGANLYWTNGGTGAGTGSVMRCAVGGCGGSPTTMASGLDQPYGIVVDSQFVYWANRGTAAGSGSIQKLPK